MKPLFIVNPGAGGGRAGKMFPEIRPIAERALGPIDVAMTTKRGDATDLAREATRDRRELVVSVGGDGTLHEVANGVLDAGGDGTAVGFVGQGTGGDFRRALGLEHRLDRYLEAIARGTERRVDVGRATFKDGEGEARRWFVNVLSSGLGGLVDRFVETGGAGLPATLKYALASARAIAAIEPAHLTVTSFLNGEKREHQFRTCMLAVCNGSSFGSGMRIAPVAAIDDGRFEVVVFTAATRLGLASVGAALYSGTHLGRADVTHFACDRLEVSPAASGPAGPARPVLLDVDGEPLGSLPLRIELVPRALRLRA